MARYYNNLLNTIRKRTEEAGLFQKDCFRFQVNQIMPMKQWCRKFQPVQLYIILLLTMLFFITELIYSHLTHAITLLMNSYQMLCNICALTGCIITMKNVKNETTDSPDKNTTVDNSSETTNREAKLKNTFGWARIEVISMLICSIFLASFSISVVVEAIQTLFHIDHLDEMHHPISVMCIGAFGLLINGICYLLIGGYTFHQGSFLFVTESGDVILNRVIVPETVTQGGRRLSRTRTQQQQQQQQQQNVTNKQRQGFREMCRDILGCVLVIICSILVYFTDKNIAKYIDPAMALISSASLMILSYPYMKESCLILLQTIPATINIDALKADLLKNFKDIVNIHDLHVWQLTTTKIISTVHIIFQNQQDYHKIMDDIKEFLVDYGITQVTIQPEFFTKTKNPDSCKSSCVLQCQSDGCAEHHCCFNYEEKPVQIFGKKLKESSTKSLPDLRSIKIIDKELSRTTEEISISESNQS